MTYDVAILGAGASGLMAASNIKNKKICLIDHNKNIGEKIKVSGGSKCNITNKYLDENYYLGDQELIKNTLKNFDQNDLLKFLNKNGIFPKVDEKIVKGTYFCKSSSDVINMFKKLIQHVHLKLQTKVLDVDFDELFIIKTDKGIIKSKKLIVASGSLAYPALGASGIAYEIAQKFGHNIVKTQPALVGFTVQKDQFWFKQLSGLSIDAKIKVSGKTLEGKMLFTHKGCSGPVILTTSLYWQKGQISVDFQPNKKSYLPKRLRTLLKENNVDIHDYKMAPAGNFGYTKAEVTKGGIDTAQLTSEFESKIQSGLYFIGENLDVTGELGGYNFQWAFSSAVKCTYNI